MLVVTFNGNSDPVVLDESGSTVTVTQASNSLTFAADAISALTVMGSSATDNLQLHAPIAPFVTFNSNGGSDNIAITGGTYTFGSDFSA